MRMWSKGLGRTELEMDFRSYSVSEDPERGDVLISGTITDPVNWEFRITMTPQDVAGLMKVALSYCMLKLILKNAYRYFVYLFSRKKHLPDNSVDMVKRVDRAYEQMMSQTRSKPKVGSRTRPKRQSSQTASA